MTITIRYIFWGSLLGFFLHFAQQWKTWLECPFKQRWSPRGRPWPRGHILKSLALASKVKSLALASRPQVLENWPVLGSRTALFFELLKFCGALEKFFRKRFFVEIARKIFVKTFFFFWRSPEKFLWRAFFFLRALVLVSLVLALASSIPVLGLDSVCPRKGCPWPRIFFVSLALASSLVSSTPPLLLRFTCTKRINFWIYFRSCKNNF